MNDLSPSMARRLAGIAFALAPVYPAAATAGQPVVTLTPLTATTLTLPADGEAVVQYLATNQSNLAHAFAMTPIAGVALEPGSGHCTAPFVLAAHASCVLALHFTGSAMNGDVHGGPLVCINDNPLACWQPTADAQLHVTLLPAQVATIAATPAALTIAVGSTAVITVDNAADSPVAAEGLAVEVPPASSILVDLGSCAAPLAPAASCTIVIGGAAAETSTLVIAGAHTTTAAVVVTLVDDVVFADGFDRVPPA
jgi:hypothetical protein